MGNLIFCTVCEKYIVYMFSSSFTQQKVAKGQIFTTALPKDNLNPAV